MHAHTYCTYSYTPSPHTHTHTFIMQPINVVVVWLWCGCETMKEKESHGTPFLATHTAHDFHANTLIVFTASQLFVLYFCFLTKWKKGFVCAHTRNFFFSHLCAMMGYTLLVFFLLLLIQCARMTCLFDISLNSSYT